MDANKLLNCMKNPVKSQIVLSLQQHKNLTAKDFLQLNSSISQATLYRALKKLEEDEIIEIVSQVQKRGTYEKNMDYPNNS